VKLLLDQNLSHKLVSRLEPSYPGTKHVKDVEAEREHDAVLWDRCKRDGFVLVTKDHDFEDAAAYPGPPPKVILIDAGNSGTAVVMSVMTQNQSRIEGFENTAERTLRLR
jgi:predicted nuclease of predicted toxin-antitoxin system